MNTSARALFRRWFCGALACAALGVTLAPTAEANSLYWRRYSPGIVGPGPVFITPPGNLWNGGWWMSVDIGPSPLSICRISDGPRWVYGNYYNGNCAYYSPSLSRGVDISVGFDLMGGSHFPTWRPISDVHRYPFHLNSPSVQVYGDPTLIQQEPVQNSELADLCRIHQDDGAFIGTLQDDGCFSAWTGQILVSADYEVVETTGN